MPGGGAVKLVTGAIGAGALGAAVFDAGVCGASAAGAGVSVDGGRVVEVARLGR